MNQHKKNTFRNVLRAAQPALPNADFTATVMREIEASTQQETVDLTALTVLLKKDIPARTPIDFTASVMDNITQLPAKKIYQPIISKRIGIAIAACIAVVIIFIGVGQGSISNATPVHSSYQTVAAVNSVPLFYPLLLMATALLLVLDYFLNPKQKQDKQHNAH